MAYTELDWGWVARTTLIGGIIGAIVGLIPYFFGKPPKKDDEPNS
jgi:hypothetical protein